MITLRIFAALLAIWSVNSQAIDELYLLHKLHTQTYQNLSHYYMFSALEGDTLFGNKLTKGIQKMDISVQRLGSSRSQLVKEQAHLISEAFHLFAGLVTGNHKYFIQHGYAEGQLETEMSNANNLLATQLQIAYQQMLALDQRQLKQSVNASRLDAIMLSKMLASYTAHALNNPTLMLNDRHKGRPLDELTLDFNLRISQLGKLVLRPDSLRKFRSANGKWRLVSKPMETYKKNAMPHLVHRYSNAIIEELNFIAQLESQPQQ